MKKLLILSLGLAAFAGCSSDASGPKKVEADGLKDRGLFCKAWAEAACTDKVVNDCQATDLETCIAMQKTHCTTLVPPGYKSARAEECIAAVSAAYDDAELNKAELDLVFNLGGECGHLVEGGSDEDGPCTVSTDCNTVKGYLCVIKPGDDAGTCQIPTIQSAGQKCSGLDEICGANFYCDAGGHCVAAEGNKGDCMADAMCESTLLCDFTDAADGEPGKCAPKLARNQECTPPQVLGQPSAECASGVCLQGPTVAKCADFVGLTFGSDYCTDLGGG